MVCRLEFVLVYVSLQLLTRYLLFRTFNDLVWYGRVGSLVVLTRLTCILSITRRWLSSRMRSVRRQPLSWRSCRDIHV